MEKHSKHSLRRLLPHKWSESQDCLRYESIILGYGIGPIESKVGDDVGKFIKEHCQSAHRLRALALASYESFAELCVLPSWVGIGTMSFVTLTAGVAALDAMACVLHGVLLGSIPSGPFLPDIASLEKSLNGSKGSACEFLPSLVRLSSEQWYTELKKARNHVVHKGFWPKVGETDDFQLVQEHRPFAGMAEHDKSLPLNFHRIMTGLLTGLEMWEHNIAAKLAECTKFTSFVQGPVRIQCPLQGQVQCDSFLGFTIIDYDPTPELRRVWGESE